MSRTLEMFRGDAMQWKLGPWQDPMQPEGINYDLTGAVVRFTAKYNFPNPQSQAVMRYASNGTSPAITVVAPATLGQIVVTTAPVDTAALPDCGSTELVWDVEIVTAGGLIRTLEVGRMVISPDVTTGTVVVPPPF